MRAELKAGEYAFAIVIIFVRIERNSRNQISPLPQQKEKRSLTLSVR